MSPVVTRTFPADHVTPLRAYAALRAEGAGRSSFLFESTVPGDRWGRYAILGYKARVESIYPSGFDPLAMLEQELGQGEAAASLAESVSRAYVGFISCDAVYPGAKVEPWPNEAYLGRFMQDATVVVFDSLAQTMTIAGPSQGAINRCAWEMTRGPELRGLPALDPSALPEYIELALSDDAYAARVARAQARLAAGEASEVVLGRAFRAALRDADPLDAYRALRLLAPAEHLFFLDFAETSFAPGLIIAGASSETLVRVARDPATGALHGASPAVAAARAVFPSAKAIGAPVARAAGIIRELEAGPRRIFGGAVGYFGVDGSAEIALGDAALWVEQGYFEVTAGARITEASVPAEEAERTKERARAALSSIRAAHDARTAREAAAEKAKAKAERAADESP